ncbi:MAG: hypothetical protein K8T26_03240 [Lentisphaerae bacterium]|nr:hypothetical protein [Lentisphaerota bacterium]
MDLVFKPRVPWRVLVGYRKLRKFALRVLLNLIHRRPFWSRAHFTTLHRMIDLRRVAPTAIPVVINNFNRHDSLRTLVAWLQRLEGEKAIIILDNASTYPPLLDYYRTLRDVANVQVVRLGYNSCLEGIKDAVAEMGAFRRYVVTDADLVPYPNTPSDILRRMDALLERYPQFSQVGASLEIRDIPDHYPLKAKVQDWESRYWPPEAPAVDAEAYEAWVDTTFGMYRRGVDVARIEPAMRMARPYTLKHVDWYMDPAHLTDEQKFYLRVAKPVASWTKRLREQGSPSPDLPRPAS